MSLGPPVYLDRLLHYVSFYLFKLLSATPNAPKPHLLFSGGIGERSSRLRADVVARLHFLGVSLDGKANGGKVDGVMRIGGGGQVEGVWVVETDEEGECAKMAVSSLSSPLSVALRFLSLSVRSLTDTCGLLTCRIQRKALDL